MSPHRFSVLRVTLVAGLGGALLLFLMSLVPSENQRRMRLGNGELLLINAPPSATSIEYVFGQQDQRRRATLLRSNFEQPLMFLPSPAPKAFICIFDFDVGLRLLVFSTDRAPGLENLSTELRTIVPASEMYVRLANASERDHVLKTLAAMDNARFRELSLATWKFGPVKFYAKRRNLIERLKEPR